MGKFGDRGTPTGIRSIKIEGDKSIEHPYTFSNDDEDTQPIRHYQREDALPSQQAPRGFLSSLLGLIGLLVGLVWNHLKTTWHESLKAQEVEERDSLLEGFALLIVGFMLGVLLAKLAGAF